MICFHFTTIPPPPRHPHPRHHVAIRISLGVVLLNSACTSERLTGHFFFFFLRGTYCCDTKQIDVMKKDLREKKKNGNSPFRCLNLISMMNYGRRLLLHKSRRESISCVASRLCGYLARRIVAEANSISISLLCAMVPRCSAAHSQIHKCIKK